MKGGGAGMDRSDWVAQQGGFPLIGFQFPVIDKPGLDSVVQNASSYIKNPTRKM